MKLATLIAFIGSGMITTAALAEEAAPVAAQDIAAPPLVAPSAAQPAPADAAPAPVETPWYRDLAVNAFVSTGISHNFTNPGPAKRNPLRVFDRENDTLKLDVAELVVRLPAETPGSAGFRLDLTYGFSVPPVVGGNDPAVQQAYGTYVIPVGSGLRLDVGTFVTHMGAEVIEGFDGYNDNYSRSILFGSAIPAAHTGARLKYQLSDAVGATVLLVNGWAQNVTDNNSGKSLGLQLALTPIEGTAFYFNYLGGPEKNDRNSDLRHLLDVVAVLAFSERLTLTFNFDFGREENDGAEPTTWTGFAGTARADFTDTFALAVRGEVFQDEDGFAGFGGTVAEATLTPTVKLSDNFVLRGDLRLDKSLEDTKVFVDNRGAPVDQQVTAALNAIFLY